MDTTRFTPNSVAISFAPSDTQYLKVGVQSIIFTSGSDSPKQLSEGGFYAVIDSTISALWLPNETCTAFADAYGLDFDGLKLQYKVSNDQHAKNVKNNPIASFQLGNLNAGGQTATVNFPYAAFDLYFNDPGIVNPTPYRYFPLRQASTPDQFILGRTFLQEAYLTVDYERKNFSLAQALRASNNATPNLQPIVSLSDSAGGSSTDGGASPSSTSVAVVSSGSSFPAGAIAGVVVGVLAIAAGIFALWFIRRRRRRPHKRAAEEKQPASDDPEAPDVNEKHGYYASEGSPGHKNGKGSKDASVNVARLELESPEPRNGRFSHNSTSNRYELPGGAPEAQEMDSMLAAGASSHRAGPSTLTEPLEAPPPSPPPSLPAEPDSPAITTDMSYFDPMSPGPRSVVSRATSVGVAAVRGAHIVDHRNGSGPGSPRSPRQHNRTSSGGTTLNDESVSGSPNIPPPPDSAFSSPRLGPGLPPRNDSVSPAPGHGHERTVSDEHPALTP